MNTKKPSCFGINKTAGEYMYFRENKAKCKPCVDKTRFLGGSGFYYSPAKTPLSASETYSPTEFSSEMGSEIIK